MRAERWQRVKEIFHVACGLPDKERASYLESECGGDQLLRSEVESLLESAGTDDTFLETPALEATVRSISKEEAAALLGQTLGHYKILEFIGAGGMGEVYLARDKRLGRKVALKLLPGYFTNDEERLRRFQREARAASALNHPNILTVYEIGKVGENHFIAAEFIDGQTLRERIRGGQLTTLEALDIALQSAGALSAAHEAGIVHRDIKPENIMIRKDGYVKVLDFGLAKLIETKNEPESLSDISTQALVHTAAGVVMGTALYMSPEQARGREVGARSDIWSLGCVLYEMLSGRPPFEGETPSHVVVSILDKEPLPLATSAKAAIPAELEAIVSRALRKKPEERYQTADDLVIALRSLKQKLEIEAALQGSQASEDSTKSLHMSSAPTVITDAHDEQKTATGQAEATRTVISAGHDVSEKIFWTKRNLTILGALALVALAAAFGIYKLTHRAQTVVSNAFAKTKLTKLTTSGKAGYAAISPDGKYVAHVSGDRGKQTMVLKHIATGSDKEIVPVTGDNYSAVAFSHDGNYIYYHRSEKNQDVLYRVPVLGGIAPTRLSEDINSTVALSFDDKRLAFVRGYPQEGTCALILANADGTGEEKFLIRKGGDLFPFGAASQAFAPAWSPDGEMIAFQSRGPAPSSGTSHIEIVQVKDKQTRTLTNQKWTGIGQISWLVDGSGLVLTAAEDSSGALQQVWYVAYPTGEARRITNDLNNYFGVSLTADSSALVTMQGEQLSNIWILPEGDTKRAVKISTGKTEGDDGVTFTPDGKKIVYTSSTTGDQDIWVMNADGSDQKQLTRNARRSSGSIVSPDGRYIVFASTRTGERRIWRIDVDGSNPKQLTNGNNDQYPCFTPDGQWVVYVNADSGATLWKVPIDGGTPVQITDSYTYKPSVSPDGKWIAALFLNEQATPKRYYVSFIPFEGGKPNVEFDFPPSRMRYVWTPDSRSLIYIVTRAGISNLWQQPIDGRQPTQITDFTSDQIFWFDYSRDHRQLALARGTQTSDVVLISDLK
jgi:serine/threonine protein kinase/Tol biopolymer transport system component